MGYDKFLVNLDETKKKYQKFQEYTADINHNKAETSPLKKSRNEVEPVNCRIVGNTKTHHILTCKSAPSFSKFFVNVRIVDYWPKTITDFRVSNNSKKQILFALRIEDISGNMDILLYDTAAKDFLGRHLGVNDIVEEDGVSKYSSQIANGLKQIIKNRRFYGLFIMSYMNHDRDEENKIRSTVKRFRLLKC